jgi:hypothetical protein
MESNRYSLTTIGGMFATSDHDQLLGDKPLSDDYFPATSGEKKRRYFETGIDALAAILKSHQRSDDKRRLWVPDNFCADSLNRLSIKLEGQIEFATYRSQDDHVTIRPNDDFLVLHFNRFDPNAGSVIRQLRQRTSGLIIEDFVHAPLDITRFTADAAFNSLRKFTALDVAVAYIDDSTRTTVELAGSESSYHVLRKQAENARSEFLFSPSAESEKQFLDLDRTAEGALAIPFVQSACAAEIARIRNYQFEEAQLRRRRNYQELAGYLKRQSPELKVIPGDYMYLMVEIPNRDRIRSALFSQRIFPAIHWADSNSEISRQLLSFHIDQRYSSGDMIRIADAVHRAIASCE